MRCAGSTAATTLMPPAFAVNVLDTVSVAWAAMEAIVPVALTAPLSFHSTLVNGFGDSFVMRTVTVTVSPALGTRGESFSPRIFTTFVSANWGIGGSAGCLGAPGVGLGAGGGLA